MFCTEGTGSGQEKTPPVPKPLGRRTTVQYLRVWPVSGHGGVGAMELKAWTGWEALTGEKTSLVDLVEEIRAWPKVEALRILSVLDVMLQNAHAQDPLTQLQLLQIVDDKLTKDLALVRSVFARETAMFIELHRVGLTQLVLAYGDEGQELPKERPDPSFFQSVLKGLLKVADLSGAKEATEQGLAQIFQ